jgi:hypothetical protein
MTRREKKSEKKIIELEKKLDNSDVVDDKDWSCTSFGLYMSGKRDVVGWRMRLSYRVDDLREIDEYCGVEWP